MTGHRLCHNIVDYHSLTRKSTQLYISDIGDFGFLSESFKSFKPNAVRLNTIIIGVVLHTMKKSNNLQSGLTIEGLFVVTSLIWPCNTVAS